MCRHLPTIRALSVLVAAAVWSAAQQPSQDHKALQGTWLVLEYDLNGKQPPAELLKKMKVVIRADRITIQPRLVVEITPFVKDKVKFGLDDAKSDQSQFKLDPAKKTKVIDLTWPDRGGSKTTKGMYLLDGDTLRICFALADGNRPKKFPGEPKSGVVRLVLKREAAGGRDSDAPGRGDEPKELSEKQQALLRTLEKEITALRGLAFKSPVAAGHVARPQGATKVAVSYDVAAKKLLLAGDPAACDRGELIVALVHALLDQHFDLAGLRKQASSTDGQLALAALIEGDATWTMIEMRRKEDPKVAAILDAPLEKAADLRKAFVSVQGARYVKALHERGGWKRVDGAYRFPPRASATILHPEGVATIDLGPGETRGEFGLIEMLARHPATATDAVRAAAGWQGDRYREDGPKKSWQVAFSTAAEAQRFQSALVALRQAQQPELKSVRVEPSASVWHDRQGAVVAVRVCGERVIVVEAPDVAGYRTLSEAADGPPVMLCYAAREEAALPFGTLIDRLLEADLVCIGETHDSDLHHRVQHQIIKALFARDERLGVGLEMFQRPFQDALDRYGRNDLGEEEFLKATEYRQRWGFAWSLYRPIVDFCRRNGVPLAALNAPRELTSRISRVGHAGLTEEEKRQLGPIDFQLAKHRDYWYERLAAMHGQKDAPAEQKERSYQVMATWDDYMAASAARFQQERNLRRLVVLAGSGHIERGFGIPERTAKRTRGKVLTIGIQIGGDPDQFRREPITDFQVIVK